MNAYPRIRPTIMASKQPETTPHSWKRCPMNNATTFVGLDVHARSIKARSQPRPQDGPPRRAYPDCVQHQCKRRRTERRVPQIQVDPLVEGNRVAVAASLPVAGHTGLHQQPLTLVVIVGCYLVRQGGARAHDAHPFCQDEKTRLPAEMLRLDS